MNKRTSSFTYTDCLAGFRPMVRTMCCIAILFGMSTYVVQAQTTTGSIMGYVYDQESKKAVPFTYVLVKQNGQFVTAMHTDLQGFFFIPRVKPGTDYVITGSTANHRAVQIHDCSVKSGTATLIEFGLQLASDTLTPLIVSGSPSFFISEQFSSAIRERERSKTFPTLRCVQDNDGAIIGTVRGTKDWSKDTYYIDGVKVRSNGINQPAEPMLPILTGTPATEAQPAATDPQ